MGEGTAMCVRAGHGRVLLLASKPPPDVVALPRYASALCIPLLLQTPWLVPLVVFCYLSRECDSTCRQETQRGLCDFVQAIAQRPTDPTATSEKSSSGKKIKFIKGAGKFRYDFRKLLFGL